MFSNGCLAVGVPYTSDPHTLLVYSVHLTEVDRVIASRNLLLKALNTMDKNDKLLLAEADRANAYLLSSDEYHKFYKDKTNWDEIIDGDITKAEELYFRAIKLFVELSQYYNASNTAYLLSLYYRNLNQPNKQCEALNDSMKYHRIGIENDPEKGENVKTSWDTNSFEEFIHEQQKKYNCD